MMKTRRNTVKIMQVQFTAIAGADVQECINECIAFSAKNEIPCTLTHNEITVQISAQKLCDKIYKEWQSKLNKK